MWRVDSRARLRVVGPKGPHADRRVTHGASEHSNQSSETKGGQKARLDWGKLEPAVGGLTIKFTKVESDPATTSLVIRFGGHELKTLLRVKDD